MEVLKIIVKIVGFYLETLLIKCFVKHLFYYVFKLCVSSTKLLFNTELPVLPSSHLRRP